VVFWRLVQGDLEPGQPIAGACPASSKAIDAPFGTKGGSPRVVPDETKLSITNCASCGSARSRIFGAVQHCSLLLVLSSLFVDYPFFTVALHEPVRLSDACSLRRSRSAVQLHLGNRPASKGVTETIRRSMALALKADHFRNGADSAVPSVSRPLRFHTINARGRTLQHD
jgi:hypothetical protein